MDIKRAGVIGVAGLTTAALGAWTFGAFDGGDEPAASAAPAPAGQVAPAPAKPAVPVTPPVQQVSPHAAVPAAPAARSVPVKKVAKVSHATPAKKKVKPQRKTRKPVVRAAVAKTADQPQAAQMPPLMLVVQKPAMIAPDNGKKNITESLDKANGSLDKAKQLVDQAKGEVDKAKGELNKAKDELKKLKHTKHTKHTKHDKHKQWHELTKDKRKEHKPSVIAYKPAAAGQASVTSDGLKPGQSRTVKTSSPDGSSWSSASVSVK